MNGRRHSRSLLISLVTATALVAGACGDDGASEGGDASLDAVKASTVQILTEGEIRKPEGTQSTQGSGSGFIITSDGMIVTNNHVVTGAGATKVRIAGSDDELPAKILGVSECTDLAVIQLTDPDDYPTLRWSDAEVAPPLEVYAAGFPLGNPEFTMTKGIVSKAAADGNTNWASVRQVIEHDAAIQPGNSGGPLVDARGQVVGVNYAGGDPGTGTAQYFAINATQARAVVDKLKDGDDDSIGVNGQAFVDADAGVAGVWVSGVAPGGIASQAGIKPGDIITTLNGVALDGGTLKEYCDVLRSNDLDSAMSVRVLRSDTQEQLEGELNGSGLEVVFSFASQMGGNLPAGGGGGGEGGGGGGGGTAPSTESVELRDDTGSLLVGVPSNWNDVSTSPQDILGLGFDQPTIIAAPSLQAFNSDSGPGVLMVLIEGVDGVSPAEVLQAGVEGSTCTVQGQSDYSDPVFIGRYAELDCGAVLSILLIATPTSDPSTMVFLGASAASQADLHALDQVLATFNLL